MKRLGQCLLGLAFAALLILSRQALVERPEQQAAELPPIPLQSILRAASEAVPAEDLLGQHLPDAASGRFLPDLTAATVLPAAMPVRDGNGIPLGARSYVRTAYASCRLEETSG